MGIDIRLEIAARCKGRVQGDRRLGTLNLRLYHRLSDSREEIHGTCSYRIQAATRPPEDLRGEANGYPEQSRSRLRRRRVSPDVGEQLVVAPGHIQADVVLLRQEQG